MSFEDQREALARIQLQALNKVADDLVAGSAGIVSKGLESRHRIGDTVTITAKIAGIQFSDSKVRYAFDLGEHLSIVDSEHVAPAFNAGKD